MDEQSTHERRGLIQGQVLHSGRRRDVILFLYEGRLWVADFVDGESEFVDATTWVGSNCGGAANGRTRLPEAPPPLSIYQLARIRALVQCAASKLLPASARPSRRFPRVGWWPASSAPT